uniref:Membrane spanning 4-domains A7 n=1 Tax=Canis lupus dingo TaxID=286419 RepID=A0A8C0K3L9_CANLU
MTWREKKDYTPYLALLLYIQQPMYISTWLSSRYFSPNLPQTEILIFIIQILCCLLISSLGAILVSGPYSSHVKPTISTILMSGYPFVGALCFAITGSLCIISGKKSTKPFAMSSLTSNVVSSLAAGVGLFLLADGLVALGTVSQRCDSEREYLSSLPYSMYYYAIYEFKECLLASVSLTGLLVVMLIFTVLELLMAAYASTLWWKQSDYLSSSHEYSGS